MSAGVNLSDLSANTQATAFAPSCNGGAVNIYSGPQPASADTAISGQTLLATLTFGSPAWGAASSGILTANAITPGTGLTNGTAAFARLVSASSATIADIQVNVSAAGLNLSSTAIVTSEPVTVNSFTWGVTETGQPPAGQVPNLAAATANAQAAAFGPLCNGGTINLYSGTQPVNANTALSSNTLLSTLTFQATAFGAPTAGLLTANPIISGTNVASATCTFARVLMRNGTSVVMDMVAGVTGSALNLNSVNILDGAMMAINSFFYQVN
jgi:hypothetical protein